MRNVWMLRCVAIVTLGMMVLSGCETTGQGAGLGAALGAGLGYAVTGDAKGAAIGAAIGAGLGALISYERQRQIANRAQLEAEYANAGMEMPTGPFVRVEKLAVAPSPVNYGEEVSVAAQYQVLNAQPGAKGTMRIFRDGEEIHSRPIVLVEDERGVYDAKVKTPKELYPGEYVVLIELENGPAVSGQKATFELVEV